MTVGFRTQRGNDVLLPARVEKQKYAQ